MFIRPRAAVTSAPPRVDPDVRIKTSERAFKGKVKILHVLIQTVKTLFMQPLTAKGWEGPQVN